MDKSHDYYIASPIPPASFSENNLATCLIRHPCSKDRIKLHSFRHKDIGGMVRSIDEYDASLQALDQTRRYSS